MKQVPQMKGRDERMSRLFLLSQSAPIFGSPILHNRSYFGYLYESLLEGAIIVEGIVSFHFFSVTRTKPIFFPSQESGTHIDCLDCRFEVKSMQSEEKCQVTAPALTTQSFDLFKVAQMLINVFPSAVTLKKKNKKNILLQ